MIPLENKIKRSLLKSEAEKTSQLLDNTIRFSASPTQRIEASHIRLHIQDIENRPKHFR